MENTVCKSAQTDDCSGNHPRRTPQADVSRNVRHVLEDSSGGWIQTGQVTDDLENWVSPKKKSPKKPMNRMCPGEESTDEPTQSGISITGPR